MECEHCFSVVANGHALRSHCYRSHRTARQSPAYASDAELAASGLFRCEGCAVVAEIRYLAVHQQRCLRHGAGGPAPRSLGAASAFGTVALGMTEPPCCSITPTVGAVFFATLPTTRRARHAPRTRSFGSPSGRSSSSRPWRDRSILLFEAGTARATLPLPFTQSTAAMFINTTHHVRLRTFVQHTTEAPRENPGLG